MKNIDALCTRKQFLIGSSVAAVGLFCVCCRLSPEAVRRRQQLRNQLTMCLIFPSTIRSSIGHALSASLLLVM
jgi:hypothetical protein